MKPKLTYERLTEVLSYNQETGNFSWRVQRKRAPGQRDVGFVAKGRLIIGFDRRKYAASRLAWFYVTKEWPTGQIVPRNGNHLDLRFENFMETDHSSIVRASALRADSTSGIKGVSWDTKKKIWVASVHIRGVRKHLGYFHDKDEAAKAVVIGRDKYVHKDTPTSMPPEMREKARVGAKYRGLWNRTLKNACDLTGWATFEDFRRDIGGEPHSFGKLVPRDATKMIGPGNWEWGVSLYAQFDTSTREGKQAYNRACRQNSPFIYRGTSLRKNFGLSLAQYHEMFDAQNGVCANCLEPEHETRNGKVKWLAVDHCHGTGEVRGLLCHDCNRGIGCFRDNPDLLRKAADYLERHVEKTKSTNGAVSNIHFNVEER